MKKNIQICCILWKPSGSTGVKIVKADIIKTKEYGVLTDRYQVAGGAFAFFKLRGEYRMERIGRDRVERVARIYASNKDASQALGITLGSFGRLCRKFAIETPYARRRRRKGSVGLDFD